VFFAFPCLLAFVEVLSNKSGKILLEKNPTKAKRVRTKAKNKPSQAFQRIVRVII
jgi:hypothetical protein